MLLFIKQARIFPPFASELPELVTLAEVTETGVVKNSRVVNAGVTPCDK